jgi:hypothetical protein
MLKVECEGVDCIHLTHNRDAWVVLIGMIMYLWVP